MVKYLRLFKSTMKFRKNPVQANLLKIWNALNDIRGSLNLLKLLGGKKLDSGEQP